MTSPIKGEGKDGWSSRLAASLGIAKDFAATKLYRSFEDTAVQARAALEAEAHRIKLIHNALNTHWACKTLSVERKKLFFGEFKEVVFNPDDKITQAGERGEYCYLVEEGEVEVVLEGDLILRVLLPEQLGGGKSALRQSREATPNEVIQHIVKVRATSANTPFEICLLGEEEKILPLFTPLSTYAAGTDRLTLRIQLAREEVKGAEEGKYSVSTGERKDAEGRPVRKRIEPVAVLGRGSFFGELGIVFATTRQHTVRARRGRPARCLAFPSSVVQMAFAGSPIFPCLAVLRSSEILAGLSTWHLARAAAAMTSSTFEAGEVLLKKDGFFEHLAVVLEGTARYDNSDKTIAIYGDTEMFMLQPEPATCNIVAVSSGVVFRLPRSALVNVLGTEYQRLQDIVHRDVVKKSDEEKQRKIQETRARQREWRLQALEGHWLLSQLSKDSRAALVDVMFTRLADDGSVIIAQGERGEHCFVLEQGEAEVWQAPADFTASVVGKPECLARVLTPGAVFGELAIAFSTTRTATVTAKGLAVLQCIPEHALLTALQELQATKQAPTLLEHALFLRQAPCVSGVAGLGPWEMVLMAKTLQRDTFAAGSVVFKQGDAATRFYLLEQGEAQSTINDKVVATYKIGDQFGEAVATETPNHPHGVTAVTGITTLSVGKDVFETAWQAVGKAIQERERLIAKAKRLRRKDQVLEEFVQSEKLYSAFLHILIDQFLTPLKPVLSEVQLQKMFSNAEAICSCHDLISSELTAKNAGEVLAKHADNLQCYTPYIRNYDEAGELVKTLNKSHKGFQKFMADKREHPEAVGGLDLMSYLIMPIQRIPRYRMLLEEIFRFSDSEDRDFVDLSTALTKIKAVALGVNEAKRQFEEEEALAKAVGSIAGKVPASLIAPHRKVVTELENMQTSDKKRKGPFRLIVFNDMIVVVKQTNSHFRGIFEFASCSVHLFHNVVEKKAQGVSIVPLVEGVKLAKGAKESKLFSHNSPCAFTFTQSTPEQIARATKLVDTAKDWVKE